MNTCVQQLERSYRMSLGDFAYGTPVKMTWCVSSTFDVDKFQAALFEYTGIDYALELRYQVDRLVIFIPHYCGRD